MEPPQKCKKNKHEINSFCVRTSGTCEETYIRCVEYGTSKAHYTSVILFGKAILAGLFVGVCAHASGIVGGMFYYHKLRELVGSSLSSFFYSITFPVAFLCIICTGSDLFTGNTMAVTIAMLQRKIKVLQYLRVMSISLIGNYIGAVASAFVISYGSGAFADTAELGKNHVFQFLNYVAVKKVNHTFIECVCLAIGCNIFVCLALYFVLTIRDGAGLIFSVFFAVYSFAVAGYEHIIANMYTLNLALMVKTDVSFGSVYLGNLLPTFIGNYIAGAVILAIPLYWFYNQHYENYSLMNNEVTDVDLKDFSVDIQNKDDKLECKYISQMNEPRDENIIVKPN